MGKRKNTGIQKVVKANELIQRGRFDLSLRQQRIVLFLIAQISPYDDEFKFYEFSIHDFCRICGIDQDGGRTSREIENAIKELADKSIWVLQDSGEKTLLRWIEHPTIDERNGRIRLKIDELMRPFLLNLRENFTQYDVIWTMDFNSKYAIRLYELVKSIHYHEVHPYERVYALNDLKEILGASQYTYTNFKARVLEPAVEEINEGSDKIVQYTPIKEGRSVAYIKFTVTSKEPLDRLKTLISLEEKYDLNQTCLWDIPELNNLGG